MNLIYTPLSNGLWAPGPAKELCASTFARSVPGAIILRPLHHPSHVLQFPLSHSTRTTPTKILDHRRWRCRPRNCTPTRQPYRHIDTPDRATRQRRHRNQLTQQRGYPRRPLLRPIKPENLTVHPRQAFTVRPRRGAEHPIPTHQEMDPGPGRAADGRTARAA